MTWLCKSDKLFVSRRNLQTSLNVVHWETSKKVTLENYKFISQAARD